MRAPSKSGQRSRTVLAAGLLTASLALGGCSGSSGSSGDSADSKAYSASREGAKQGAPGDGAADADSAAKAPTNEAAGAKKPPSAQTHVIHTTTLSVEVKSATKALTTARTAAENAGGLVGSETTERNEGGNVYSRIVLRVPQDAYEDVLKELSGTGKQLERKAQAKDVTDQVVDVDSRIKSQRTSVARVRDMMDQATKLSDVVMLEGELSTRQTELEALLAQQASLKDRTSLATITLELSEPEPKKVVKKDEDPGFLDALSGGWNAFVTMVTWVAMALGAVAPFAAAIALLYVLWRVLRGRLPKRQTPPAGQEQPQG